MAGNILIIEDEAAIADTIVYALQTEGYQTQWHTLGVEAIDSIKNESIDLVILDIGLPDISGFEVCKQIRQYSQVPIIFLTARHEEVDRVVGLEIGGDDYVTKPFSPRELVARVKVILKRTQASIEPTVVEDQRFTLDAEKAQIHYKSTLLDLTKYEFLILKTFVQAPERVFSREQLMATVWDAPDTVTDRVVDTHIKTLRSKLKLITPEKDPIKTHRGLGYSLVRIA